MSTSQQAGINGVKDEAISLSGQLLVGGSSLMYLKSLHDSRHHFIKMHPSTKTFFQKVNLRTNGFVIFFLTAQAVGFQTYTAYQRGQRLHYQRVVSGVQPVAVPVHRSLQLRLLTSAEIIAHYSSKPPAGQAGRSLPVPVLTDLGTDPAAPQPRQQQHLPHLSGSSSWRDRHGVLAVEPSLCHCLTRVHDNREAAGAGPARRESENHTTNPSTDSALYLEGSQVEHCLAIPTAQQGLVVLEAETGTNGVVTHTHTPQTQLLSGTQGQCSKHGQATALQDRLVNRFRGNVQAVSVIIDWTPLTDALATKAKPTTDDADAGERMDIIVDTNNKNEIVINGNYFLLGKISQWLREVEETPVAQENKTAEEEEEDKKEHVVEVEDANEKEKTWDKVTETEKEVAEEEEGKEEDIKGSTQEQEQGVQELSAVTTATQAVDCTPAASVHSEREVQEELLQDEGEDDDKEYKIRLREEVLASLQMNADGEEERNSSTGNEEEGDEVEIEEEGDEEELYHVRLMFSFFEWTGENIRHSSQALLQGLRSAAGRGCSEVARVSGGLLQSFRQTTQGLDFSLLRAQFALLLESKGESKDDQIEAAAEDSREDLWIHFNGADKPDRALLSNFLQNTLTTSQLKKDYHLHVMPASPDACSALPQACLHAKKKQQKLRAKVVVFGQSCRYEEDLQVAHSLAQAGCTVLLLTPHDRTHAAAGGAVAVGHSGENTNAPVAEHDHVSVASIPEISEDIFLYVNTLLELSFHKDSDSITKSSDASLTEVIRRADRGHGWLCDGSLNDIAS